MEVEEYGLPCADVPYSLIPKAKNRQLTLRQTTMHRSGSLLQTGPQSGAGHGLLFCTFKQPSMHSEQKHIDTPPRPHATLNQANSCTRSPFTQHHPLHTPTDHPAHPDRSRRGQRVQKVQVGCRKNFTKVHPLPKLDCFPLSFDGCGRCGRCRFFKNFSTSESSRLN